MPTVEPEWNEAKLQSWFIKEARAYGYFAIKLTSMGRRGFPDVLLAKSSRIPVFIELKTRRGKLSKIQMALQYEMHLAGMDVRTYYGKVDAEKFFREEVRLA